MILLEQLSSFSVIHSLLYTFFLLLFAHYLADFPLQGDFLAKAKSKDNAIEGVPCWIPMTAHCGIHGGLVMIITNSVLLGMFEFISHYIIDSVRCSKEISFPIDQYFHVLIKVIILILWFSFMV